MSKPAKGMYSVCAVDIVGFTRASDDEQRTMFLRLNQFADDIIADREFIKISTGDGLIVSMWGTGPYEALQFAKELLSKIKSSVLRIPIRTGINVGTGYLVQDGDKNNIIGNAINIACRIMDIGDENHILLDANTADIIINEGSVPSKFMHKLGGITVKHGLSIETFSYFDEVQGNPMMPSKIFASTGIKQLSLGRPIEVFDFFHDKIRIDILTNAAPWLSHTEFLNQLEKMVIECNANLRVVLIDKEGEYARMRQVSPSYRTIDELDNTVSYILSLLEGLAERIYKGQGSGAGMFEVKITREPIYFSMFINEEDAMIGLYSPITTGSKGLHAVVKEIDGDSAYQWICKSFDHYFERAKTVINKELWHGDD